MNHLSDNQIISYIEHSLSEKESAEIIAHIESCKICKREYLAHKAVMNKLSDTKSFKLHGGFTYSVLKRLNLIEEKKKTPVFFRVIISFIVLMLVGSIISSIILASGISNNTSLQILQNINISEYINLFAGYLNRQGTILLFSISLLIVIFFISEIFNSGYSVKKK